MPRLIYPNMNAFKLSSSHLMAHGVYLNVNFGHRLIYLNVNIGHRIIHSVGIRWPSASVEININFIIRSPNLHR